jgi:ABC-2 type transport system ATP-binding protein
MPDVIEVSNIRKVYGNVVAVEDISFSVAEGEIFGMLGPNGAGKTTTVECLQGLRHHDSGMIKVLGFDPRTQAVQLRRHIGSQLQESALPDRMKVWEALDLFSSVSSRSRDWHTLLDQWGIADKKKSAFANLSGGQRQRLFIALALVNNPRVVFLDEMTTGLDPAARRVAWDLIREIRDMGTTVVLVTHFMDEAETLCDRLAIIDKGKVVAVDNPHGLVATHVKDVRVVFTWEQGDFFWLYEVPGVRSFVRHGMRVEVTGDGPLLAYVAAALVEHGVLPEDLRVERPSLEDVFLKLTGHGLEA